MSRDYWISIHKFMRLWKIIKNAFKYHKLYIQVQDSIKSSNLKKQLSELQVKYEVDQLNHENYRLETKNRRILVITLLWYLYW